MSNVLSQEKKEQVVALGRLGWSLRRIEETTGVRRETAGTYLRGAGIPVRRPGGWGKRPPAKPAIEVTTDPESREPSLEGLPGSETSKPAIEVTTDSGSQNRAIAELGEPVSTSGSGCEPYREIIERDLSRGRNGMAIWQDLVPDHGFANSYQSVKRFVGKLRGSQGPQAAGIIQTGPGEEAQVNYGTGPMVRDPKTGKYRRTRLFVMTLGYSRKSVRLLTFKSSSHIWAELHETAFRRLGGSPRYIILDNLREGVIVSDYYDPTLNPLFKDVLAHYGVVAMPCRVRDPDRKGKVESGVGHAQKTPLKGQRFESLDLAQAYLDRWETRWADTQYRVINWAEYNESLRQRGDLTIRVSEEAQSVWSAPRRTSRGGQRRYSDLAIETCLTLRTAYRLGLRETQGLMGSIGTLMGLWIYGCRITPHCHVAQTA